MVRALITRAGFDPAGVRRWLPAGIAAVLLLGVAAVVVGREVIAPATPAAPEPSAARSADDGLVRFRDAAGGISISRPADWQRVASPDPEVRLLAVGDDSSMLVRMADLGTEIGPDRVDDAKQLTDSLVRRAGNVKFVRPPQQVTLGGLPGYLYLYTFRDATSKQRAAHAHYFLFRGRSLITIVFETAPPERLLEVAPLFDRIGETLRSSPAPALRQ